MAQYFQSSPSTTLVKGSPSLGGMRFQDWAPFLLSLFSFPLDLLLFLGDLLLWKFALSIKFGLVSGHFGLESLNFSGLGFRIPESLRDEAAVLDFVCVDDV